MHNHFDLRFLWAMFIRNIAIAAELSYIKTAAKAGEVIQQEQGAAGACS